MHLIYLFMPTLSHPRSFHCSIALDSLLDWLDWAEDVLQTLLLTSNLCSSARPSEEPNQSQLSPVNFKATLLNLIEHFTLWVKWDDTHFFKRIYTFYMFLCFECQDQLMQIWTHSHIQCWYVKGLCLCVLASAVDTFPSSKKHGSNTKNNFQLQHQDAAFM